MVHNKDNITPPGTQPVPSNEREWRVFERQYGRWLKDNATSIPREEGDLFKRATYSCLGVGISAGVLVNLTLSRTNLIKKAMSRRIFSMFTAFYFTAACINQKRRPLYKKLLASPGSLGVAARKILNETRRLPPTGVNGYPMEAGNMDPAVRGQFEAGERQMTHEDTFSDQMEPLKFGDDELFTSENNNTNAWNTSQNGSYKTWDDIRKASSFQSGDNPR
ncbi:hypothetical protein BaOVIS_000420 [Babesia ovis]|uniref:Uncharacterized protein n=1 Tax=Babesia ovis TaxID=5869 RepID=A0A9W5T9E2_BABOV|nr:hypothetical protein BaOVIS_000420 [Babesia ovis]